MALIILVSCNSVSSQLLPGQNITLAARLRASAPSIPPTFGEQIKDVKAFSFSEKVTIGLREIDSYIGRNKVFLLTTGFEPPKSPLKVTRTPTSSKPAKPKALNKPQATPGTNATNHTQPRRKPYGPPLDATTTSKLLSTPANYSRWLKIHRHKLHKASSTSNLSTSNSTQNKTLDVKKIELIKQKVARAKNAEKVKVKKILKLDLKKRKEFLERIRRAWSERRKKALQRWMRIKYRAANDRINNCVQFIEEYSLSPDMIKKTREGQMKSMSPAQRSAFLKRMERLDKAKARRQAIIDRYKLRLNPAQRASYEKRLEALKVRYQRLNKIKVRYCRYLEARRTMLRRKYRAYIRALWRRRYLLWKKKMLELKYKRLQMKKQALLAKQANSTHQTATSPKKKPHKHAAADRFSHKGRHIPWFHRWKKWVSSRWQQVHGTARKTLNGRVLRGIWTPRWMRRSRVVELWPESRQREAYYRSRRYRPLFHRYQFANASPVPTLSDNLIGTGKAQKSKLASNTKFRSYISHSQSWPKHATPRWALRKNPVWTSVHQRQRRPSKPRWSLVVGRRPTRHQLLRTSSNFTVDSYKALRITFKPFIDLSKLKVGTSYEQIRVEQAIHSPGLSFVKLLATSGVRVNDVITYQTGYGWAYGMALPKTKSISVRKCKFVWNGRAKQRTKRVCKKVSLVVKRDFVADEVRIAKGGLANHVYTVVADQLAGGRSLRSLRSSKLVADGSLGIYGQVKVFQRIRGILPKDLPQAVQSLIPDISNTNLNLNSSSQTEQFTIKAETATHVLQVDRSAEGLLEIQVWTI